MDKLHLNKRKIYHKLDSKLSIVKEITIACTHLDITRRQYVVISISRRCDSQIKRINLATYSFR